MSAYPFVKQIRGTEICCHFHGTSAPVKDPRVMYNWCFVSGVNNQCQPIRVYGNPFISTIQSCNPVVIAKCMFFSVLVKARQKIKKKGN